VHALVNHSNSDESVNLNSALSMNITAPYEMIGKTKTRGQLKTGFKADFVCLSEDPFLVLQSKLREIEVNATYINGLPVFNLQT
jgi:predicted amidohydrolase YtcJ